MAGKMMGDYPNKMQTGGKNKRFKGKTCGQCTHGQRCYEKYLKLDTDPACPNFMEKTDGDSRNNNTR